MRSRSVLFLAVALSASMTLAACGSSNKGSGGSGGSSSASRGPITYVQGKDNNNVIRPLIAKWNAAHPTEKVTFKEQSDQADQQHDDLVQHFQSKDSNYDVVDVDVIWTAEFAAKGWLQPLTGSFNLDTSGLLPATVKTATYNGKLYAAPQTTDGGLLYYRKDLVPTPPTSWSDLIKDCAIAKQHNIGCYAGQFAKYEGLTVNVAEAINSAGGHVLNGQGQPDVNTPAAQTGLALLANGFKQGYIPKQAITFQEEQARQAFESGQLLFMRNWPYAFSLVSTDPTSKVRSSFAVAPLPGINGNPGASSLGGHNAAISVYSKHKATALDFLKFLESPDTQRFFVTQASLAPVIPSLYDDAALNQKFPYLSTLKKSLDTAVPRPVTPFYPAVTKAIEDNAYSALDGSVPVGKALANMQNALKSAASGG